jgi:hypothetical protein
MPPSMCLNNAQAVNRPCANRGEQWCITVAIIRSGLAWPVGRCQVAAVIQSTPPDGGEVFLYAGYDNKGPLRRRRSGKVDRAHRGMTQRRLNMWMYESHPIDGILS